ncbi:MAG: Rossmann-like and DUF2520 domain-containing protein [Peptostreptococcus sp.]|uniref:Rossmann-like and DUF2520 domain-containing protein n=1 Tax=Peptostreptococcus sp. TaxID=1262 RepID=UPI002FC8E2CC
MYNIGFIGAGKVGISLGRYLFENCPDTRLCGYYSRSIESSNYAAKLTNSAQFNNLEKLVEKCNVLIITTSDDAIAEVWRELSNFNIQNKIVCHCSGSLSSEIFFDRSSKGSFACSIHPLKAINSKEKSYKDLSNSYFTLEGDSSAIEVMKKFLEYKKNPYKIMSSADKTRYHLASVFMSNLVIGMGNISVKLLSEYGFSQEESLEALSSLTIGNINRMFDVGLEEALTGPVERCDGETIKNHIKSLSVKKLDTFDEESLKRVEKIYKLLSLDVLEIAENKHPDRDYSRIQKLLKED